jgi:hypothetical protein
MTRISTQDFVLGAFNRIELWANSNSWIPFSDFSRSHMSTFAAMRIMAKTSLTPPTRHASILAYAHCAGSDKLFEQYTICTMLAGSDENAQRGHGTGDGKVAQHII